MPEDFTVDVGVKVRRRWAIRIAGWFLSLVRVDITADDRYLTTTHLKPTIHIGYPEEPDA
jgi:hypothetical protein